VIISLSLDLHDCHKHITGKEITGMKYCITVLKRRLLQRQETEVNFVLIIH